MKQISILASKNYSTLRPWSESHLYFFQAWSTCVFYKISTMWYVYLCFPVNTKKKKKAVWKNYKPAEHSYCALQAKEQKKGNVVK